MSNKVEFQGEKVIKTFDNRIDFVRESSIYEKLKGKGLAPEIIGKWDGTLGHAYIKGECFNDVIHRAMKDPMEFIEYSNIFFKWYRSFRDVLHISLGDMDFTDFILTEEKQLYCVDFEHCKPGYAEDDVAMLAANICLMGNEYTRYGIEDAKIFVKSAWEQIEMSSKRLNESLQRALELVCEEKQIRPVRSANEYLATFVCCAFVHAPKRRIVLSKMIESLCQSNQAWTLFAEDITGENEQSIRYLMSVPKKDYNVIFLTEDGNAKLFPLLLKTEDAIPILTVASENEMSLTDAILSKFNYKPVAIESMK